MGRPRIHPRRFYRANDSGFYVDPESGDEFSYIRGRIYPDIESEKNHPYISMSRQERICKKLAGVWVNSQDVSFGRLFEPADGSTEEIERVGGETKTVE